MKTLSYTIAIDAPVAKVYSTMIAPDSYRQWTSAFNPSSYYEGNWEQGGKIHFIGINAEGKKEGMVAEIAENITNEFISIRHLGIVDGENEITEGPAVAGWAGALENYSFQEQDGITTVTVSVDTNEKYIEYFDEAWPKALGKLKQICEW